ncbi:hypothetical protein [Candidatus Nitrospira bockiana]
MDNLRKTSIGRECAIFALSVGIGGHIVLGVVLHAPDLWPIQRAGLYGLLIGASVYVTVQLGRSMWWVLQARRRTPGDDDEE